MGNEGERPLSATFSLGSSESTQKGIVDERVWPFTPQAADRIDTEFFGVKRMRNLSMIAAATAMTAGSLAVAAPAEAHHRGWHQRGYQSQRYYDNRYYGRSYQQPVRCKSGTTGTIVGGAAGALLGREIAGRGDRTLGAILGGVGGALLGREVTRTKRCYR